MFRSKILRRLAGGIFCAAVAMACSGCQTFNLSEQDFQRQQRGETVDRQTGKIVDAVGSAGYLGACVGLGTAAAVRR